MFGTNRVISVKSAIWDP